MNRHLDDEQICRWLTGERDADTCRHLDVCAACRREVNADDQAFSDFGELARDAGAAQLAARDQGRLIPPRMAAVRKRWPLWSAAALAAAAILLFTVWPSARMATSPLPVRSISETRDDSALLNQISSEVSRSIPGPMEPLANLIQTGAEGQ